MEVPEHLESLLGIGELFPITDPPVSQTGQLPHALGHSVPRQAEWFNVCPTSDLFFIQTFGIVQSISGNLHTCKQHAILCHIKEGVQSQKMPCLKIRAGTPADMIPVLAQ